LVSLAFLPGDLLKAGFAAWLARQLSREILLERRSVLEVTATDTPR
jgi:hypothetical protein